MTEQIEYRRAVLQKLRTICQGLPEDYPVRIERSCYNEAIKANAAAGQNLILGSLEYGSRYDSIATRVLLNLNPNSTVGSRELMDALVAGKFQPEDIGRLTSAELTPTANADIRHTLEIRGKQKIILKVSTAYKCRKCGESKVTFEEYQGRSGDEASNISFKCLCCGYVWHK